MNEEEQDELFKKCFYKTLKKLAEEPDEVINYHELLKKYNNLLKEKNKLQQELQRKDNNWNELKEELKEARKELQPGELIIGQGLIDNILDKIKDIENEKK